jgi:hypothetical protein
MRLSKDAVCGAPKVCEGGGGDVVGMGATSSVPQVKVSVSCCSESEIPAVDCS